MLTFVEDVGRHNAIDTIAGWMWLHDMGGADKIFYTTGRLTSEMVIKSAQMGVPIVVSRSGITQMGLELAERLGLALFGRATTATSSATAASIASTPSPSRPAPADRGTCSAEQARHTLLSRLLMLSKRVARYIGILRGEPGSLAAV
jgi:hypothetical protein